MEYLSDKIQGLPKNCLFDKGKVGCGGTSLAIECGEPYVIAVPFTSLVVNKVSQYPNERSEVMPFAVMGGVTVDDIRSYVEGAEMPKIITTYDGLVKVIEACDGDVSGLNLLVDEYHLLFTQYDFRGGAIKYLLDHFRDFASYTFMTATPLEKDFILDELKGIPVVTQEWAEDEKRVVTVQAIRSYNVQQSVIKLINKFRRGDYGNANAYFFVNSTNVIRKLIQGLNLTEKECRVIYSQSNTAKVGIPNSTVEDSNKEPKKINFLTSTVFEGCDLFDPNGISIIISDGIYRNTLVDISTSVMQIAGRIRDSKYWNKIYHIYKTNKYTEGLSLEDYKKAIRKNIRECKICVKSYNNMEECARRRIGQLKDPYIVKNEEDCTFSFDENKPKIDLFNYKVQNEYKSVITIKEEYKGNQVDVEAVKMGYNLEEDRINSGAGIDKSFKDVVLEIRNAKYTLLRTMLIRDAEAVYPFLGRAIAVLGYERIETLRYNQGKIKDELLITSDHSINYKVCKKLKYKLGDFKSNKQIKKDLQKAYDALKLNRTPKAKDIELYYDVRKAKPRKGPDGEQVEGYYIIAPIREEKAE